MKTNTDNNRGSVYSLWMEELLNRYIKVLDLVIDRIQRLPRFPDHITEVDKNNLTIAIQAIGLKKEDYGDLGDINNFMRALGDVYNRALQKVEKWLKPTDPVLEKLENLNMDKEEIDNMLEVGKGEL